ncbi:hypothetical protein E2C01_088545 [Portunus trituberculatus]|uniref:Uncharacterized protein n=1 Tax=Portunus trituberculatus TaxID=210409 RepID=A0A5B7JEY3_PORTR|nr:hypothetical protein [Portunus trituberculatus]
MFVANTSITQRRTTMVGDNTRQWDNNKPNTTNTNRHARLRHDGYFRISNLYKRRGPTPSSHSSPKLPTKTNIAAYLPQHGPGRAHSDG